jgi:hypothetical protein
VSITKIFVSIAESPDMSWIDKLKLHGMLFLS